MANDEWSIKDANRFLDAVSESIISADDAEYLAERKADGLDTKKTGDRVRAALLAGVREYFLEQRTQLAASNEGAEPGATLNFGDKTLAQLNKILAAAKAKLNDEQTLTLCFRERGAGELSKEEILSQLEKLQHLGLVDETDES